MAREVTIETLTQTHSDQSLLTDVVPLQNDGVRIVIKIGRSVDFLSLEPKATLYKMLHISVSALEFVAILLNAGTSSRVLVV